MNEADNRKWHSKKRYMFPLGFLGFIFSLGVFGAVLPDQDLNTDTKNSLQTQPVIQPQTVTPKVELVEVESGEVKSEAVLVPEVKPQATEQSVVKPSVPTSKDSPKSLPPKTYTNSQGNTVQSPTHYDSKPAGASAKCKDGTYSFSQSRRGTCSGHGGVSVWY